MSRIGQGDPARTNGLTAAHAGQCTVGYGWWASVASSKVRPDGLCSQYELSAPLRSGLRAKHRTCLSSRWASAALLGATTNVRQGRACRSSVLSRLAKLPVWWRIPRACEAVIRRAVIGIFAVILMLAVAPACTAAIYWANSFNGTIGRANTDGTDVNQSFVVGAADPSGVAVDGSHVYWANTTAGSIGRADLDGSNVNENFITRAASPDGVAVDGSHVYWMNQQSQWIGRANLDGSGVNQMFIRTAGGSGVPAVDGTYIYWPEGNSIGRANLDGSNVDQNFIAANFPSQYNIDAVAVANGVIYWSNCGAVIGGFDSIGRANLDGSAVTEEFVTGGACPTGVAADSRDVYWANDAAVGSSVSRAALDGTAVNPTFITGTNRPRGVAVDSTTPPPPATPPTNTSPPSVSGQPGRQSLLTCKPGTWAGTAPIEVAYQWLLDAVPIAGATTPVEGLSSSEFGHVLSCQVTATDVAGSAVASVAIVSNPPVRAPSTLFRHCALPSATESLSPPMDASRPVGAAPRGNATLTLTARADRATTSTMVMSASAPPRVGAIRSRLVPFVR
jgi:virginiamycin B lyase